MKKNMENQMAARVIRADGVLFGGSAEVTKVSSSLEYSKPLNRENDQGARQVSVRGSGFLVQGLGV